jgi:enoyl-CoA hydratase/carnithine racemase
MGILLTGRRVDAAEADALGLVHQVVPAGSALEGARKRADQQLECSPTSIRQLKELPNRRAACASVDDAVRTPYSAIDQLLNSDDRIEDMTAFVPKRSPQWRNR